MVGGRETRLASPHSSSRSKDPVLPPDRLTAWPSPSSALPLPPSPRRNSSTSPPRLPKHSKASLPSFATTSRTASASRLSRTCRALTERASTERCGLLKGAFPHLKPTVEQRSGVQKGRRASGERGGAVERNQDVELTIISFAAPSLSSPPPRPPVSPSPTPTSPSTPSLVLPLLPKDRPRRTARTE